MDNTKKTGLDALFLHQIEHYMDFSLIVLLKNYNWMLRSLYFDEPVENGLGMYRNVTVQAVDKHDGRISTGTLLASRIGDVDLSAYDKLDDVTVRISIAPDGTFFRPRWASVRVGKEHIEQDGENLRWDMEDPYYKDQHFYKRKTFSYGELTGSVEKFSEAAISYFFQWLRGCAWHDDD